MLKAAGLLLRGRGVCPAAGLPCSAGGEQLVFVICRIVRAVMLMQALSAVDSTVCVRSVATGGTEGDGEAGEDYSERRFVEHGEDVLHDGDVSLHGGESDEEAVAAAAGGVQTVSAGEWQKYGEDEYPESGEYSPGADKIFREGYATDSDYQAREQSDHKFDDEYPDSGEYVPAPGGTASAKFMAWHLKSRADESMHGGEVPSGVVLE